MVGNVEVGRPWLVMVTGAPGTGKTSLGLHLAHVLRVPFLSRDHIRGGQHATAGLWTNQVTESSQREDAVEAFVQIVEKAASLGVSSVLEFIVTPERTDAFRRLEAAANCVVVMTMCADGRARADRRDRGDPLLNRQEVLDSLGHSSIEDYIQGPERDRVAAAMRSEFELPLLRVATDDGYKPRLSDIVDWIIETTRG